MTPRQLKALQNIVAHLVDSGQMRELEPELSHVKKDVAVLQQYLKSTLEGDGSITVTDFEAIWKLYPNKVGRKAAQRHFFASVKSAQDLEQIKAALDHYKQSDRFIKGFVQDGSRWFNDWQSWIDPEPVMIGSGRIASRSELERQKFINS